MSRGDDPYSYHYDPEYEASLRRTRGCLYAVLFSLVLILITLFLIGFFFFSLYI